MTHEIDILKDSRKLIVSILNKFSLAQLNKIPEGFNNNIIWNAGHLAVTQQLLCYKLSGLPMHLTDEFVDAYRKGSAPKKSVAKADVDFIKKQLIQLPEQFEKDINNNLFKTYNNYATSVGITLTDIQKAAQFNNYHEGLHLGAILGLQKFI